MTFDGDDYLQRASVGFQDEDQLWFVVTKIDAGGVNHSADGIITYGGWGAGRWHIRANNGTQFRGKVYVDGNASAGTRVRKAMQQIKASAHDVRIHVQATKNNK